MNKLLRFDGRVAIITGAGSGLGKSHALLLAERGASVVINDLGGSKTGEGGTSGKAADLVVEEINKKGGKAVANYNSVVDGDQIVKTALDKFGRIDIIINNAGIIRDTSIAKMTQADWDIIYQVHTLGSYKTVRAAWEAFKAQKYGRIVSTSSIVGLLGNFGQANYASAKSSLLGFTKTLAIEGAKFNIHANVIVPLASSRLTEGILSPEWLAQMRPQLITPVVAWMAHEDCKDTGMIVESACGLATRYEWFRTKGTILRSNIKDEVTLENVRDKWREIVDLKDAELPPKDWLKSSETFSIALDKMKAGVKEDKLTKKSLAGFTPPNEKYTYSQKDTIRYAFSVGMSVADKGSLNYLYENGRNFKIVPTFPLCGTFVVAWANLHRPSLGINFEKMIHGEQYLEVYRPISPSATITLKTKVIEVLDKAPGVHYISQVIGEDENENGPLWSTEFQFIEIGGGGFGGNSKSKVKLTQLAKPPARSPDATIEYKTSVDQAALYRLNGDDNPLHIDPSYAKKGGFEKCLLHGLCTTGIAIRLIVQKYIRNDPNCFKAVKVRMSKPIFPGETLVVQTWKEKKRIHFEAISKESGQKVLSNSYMDIH